MGLLNDITRGNITQHTVDIDPNIRRYRPTPQNVSPIPNPVRTDLTIPFLQQEEEQSGFNPIQPNLNPYATLDPNLATLGSQPILNTPSPLSQPSTPDLVGFGNVTQPQNVGLPQLTIPQLRQPPEPTLDAPIFIPPAYDLSTLQTNPQALYGGGTRRDISRAIRRTLPEIETQNVIQDRFIPSNQTAGETRRETTVRRSQNWLDRVLSGVRGNNLTDRLINTLMWRINPFLGAQFGTPRSEFARTGGTGFTRADGSQWTPNNDSSSLQTFGEYGSGALGLLFYGLDWVPNMVRGAILDIGANTRALGNTLSERGGASIWRQEWRDDFGENRRLYDAVPDGHQYESYVTRALFGDDLSFINFQESRDGSYNPLGVLGESADDFYRDQDLYQRFISNPLAREQTNWFQRFMLSPSARLMPRALAAFGLEVYTDPMGGALWETIGANVRRMMRRGVQATPPLHRLLPGIDEGIPRLMPTTSMPNPGRTVSTPRGTQAIPDNFFSSGTQPRVGLPERNIDIAAELRARLRNGMPMQQAIDEVAELTPNPDLMRNINTPMWNRPRGLFVDEVVTPQWGDVVRSPRMRPDSFPIRRTAIERRTLINSVANILPPTLNNAQIDRVVNALPRRLGDEIALSARTFGAPVPQLPPARSANLPQLLPAVGSRSNPIPNVGLIRTSQNTVRIELPTTPNSIDFDQFAPLVQSLRDDFPFRLEVQLPSQSRLRNQLANMLNNFGFTQTGNRMIAQPVNQYENLSDLRRTAANAESDFIVRRTEQLRQEPGLRVVRPPAPVEDLPSARAVLQGWMNDLLDSPEPSRIIQNAELEQSNETLQDLFQRAEDIWSSPVYDDVRQRPPRQPTNVVEFVARNTGRPRGQYTDNVVQAFNNNALQVPQPRPLPTQAELSQAAREGTIAELVARAEDIIAQPRYDNPAQYAVDLLTNPDITTSPTAYREVRGTLPDNLAPYAPTPRETELVQEYVNRRDTLEGLLTEHSDLMYDLDQVRTVDAEAFYDELIMAGDDLEPFEEVLTHLREDDMYDVLVELWNDMVDERTSRNVQRYLSQLEETVDQQVNDLTQQVVAAMDDLFTQEEVLRSATDVSNRRYIEDIIDAGDIQRAQLDEALGKSSRGHCI